jgi:hypothetical protein
VRIEGFFVSANTAWTVAGNNCDEDGNIAVSDFNVGDRVEISLHKNREYEGRSGSISFIGAGLMQGTNPLDYNIDIPDQASRFIITLDDSVVVDDIQAFQLRKI